MADITNSFVKANNTWTQSVAWVKVDGTWRQCFSNVKINDDWRPGGPGVLELYSPGVETLRSSKFTVQVSSQVDQQQIGLGYRDAYVFSKARPVRAAYGVEVTGLAADPVTNPRRTQLWLSGSSPELSYLTFGVTGTVKTKISKTAGSITSAKLRPAAKNWNYEVTGGNLIINMNPMDKVWVEVNNETSTPLFVFCDPPKPTLPSGGRGLYFGPGIYHLSSIPGPHQSVTFTGTGGVSETFSGIGFSGLTNYQEGEDYYIYLDGGAYVVGSFDIRNRNNIKFIGPGILSMENMPKERFENPALTIKTPYDYVAHRDSGAIVIHGNGEYDQVIGVDSSYSGMPSGCILSGITIVDTPFFGPRGFNGIDNIKMINGWVENTDGAYPIADRRTRFQYVRDSFYFLGDDCIYAPYNAKGLFGGSAVFSGLDLYTKSNAPLSLSYAPKYYFDLPTEQKSYSAIIHSCNFGNYAYPYDEPIIRATMAYPVTSIDTTALDPKNYGLYDVTVSNIRVEDQVYTNLFQIGSKLDINKGDPYRFGGISGLTFADIYVTGALGQRSTVSSNEIWGLDASSRPTNLTFKNININGQVITNANRDNYIDWVSGVAVTGGYTDPDDLGVNITFTT